LRARGDSSDSRAICERAFESWQAILGPDHPDTLTAASSLTGALAQVGEVESARVLGEDTLQHCRRMLGPDNPITLYLTEAASAGHPMTGGDAAADYQSRSL
jgi:hypothetical protein